MAEIEKHPLAPEIIKSVLLGKMSVRDGAVQLQVSEKTFWAYLQTVKELPKGAEVPTDVLEILKSLTQRLQLRVNELLTRGIDATTERMISSQVTTLEKLIMDIAKLTDQLKTEPLIKIQQIEVQFNELQQFMFENLCPVCRKKLIDHLEEVSDEKLGPPVTERTST